MIKAEENSVSILCRKVRNGKRDRIEPSLCLLWGPYEERGAGALPEPLETEEVIPQVPWLVPSLTSPICLPLHPRASEAASPRCYVLQFPHPLTPYL